MTQMHFKLKKQTPGTETTWWSTGKRCGSPTASRSQCLHCRIINGLQADWMCMLANTSDGARKDTNCNSPNLTFTVNHLTDWYMQYILIGFNLYTFLPIKYHWIHWWIKLSYYKSFLAHRNKSLICVPMDSPGITLAKKIDKMGMRVSEWENSRIAKAKPNPIQLNSTHAAQHNSVGSSSFCFGSFKTLDSQLYLQPV